MVGIEIEYKAMLEKEEFISLENKLGDKYTYFDQTNTYFDDEKGSLHQFGVSLRIRHLNNLDKYIATVKENLIEGRLESEFEVAGNEPSFLTKEVLDILKKYKIKQENLIKTGELKTIRKEYNIDQCVFCLDHNYYCDIEDYEVECEASSMEKAKSIVLRILAENKIVLRKSSNSKMMRAKEAYKEKYL